jgi:Amt family ammonium transporter
MFGGLAFFEAGLLRSKNTQSIIMQVMAGMVVLGFMWDIVGYSLTFGDDHGGVIGDFKHSFLLGVGYNECSPHAPQIPAALFALFMMMFAAITPLLMTGSIAERINWNSFIILIVAWEVLVYYPLAHWIWGGGWLDRMGVQDFAGGIVIHTSAGAGSLVLSIMLGRRKQFEKYHGEFPPSNLPLAAIGTCMLWGGWFGFNAGSALTSGAIATSTLASTQLAAVTSGTVWLIASWIRNKPSSMMVMVGIVAGLAGITPASGYINDQSSLVLGLIIGAASYFSMWFVKAKLHIDDALDVISVHGLPGVIGSIAIGFCSETYVNPNAANGLIFHGSARLLGVQTLAVVVTFAYTCVVTFAIAIILQKTIGLRVSDAEEEQGLDLASHGEYAYHNLWMMEGSEARITSHANYDAINGTSGVAVPSKTIPNEETSLLDHDSGPAPKAFV